MYIKKEIMFKEWNKTWERYLTENSNKATEVKKIKSIEILELKSTITKQTNKKHQ